MARPLRIEYPGAFYHVMNRGQRQVAKTNNEYLRRDPLTSIGGCAANTVRTTDWRWGNPYDPPYMGVKYAMYTMEHEPCLKGILMLDLPFTVAVDTCLLPWDLGTLLFKGD